jgi:hypothetical protein
VADQEIERLRAMLSRAYEQPSPKNLKTMLRKLKNRLKPKKKPPTLRMEKMPPKKEKGAA